jgi:hypothetical protein
MFQASRFWVAAMVGLCLGVGAVVLSGSAAQAQVGEWEVIKKVCGNCGREVPLSSRVGQRCPYCGVRWGYDRRKYVSEPGYSCGSERPSRTTRLRWEGQEFQVSCLWVRDTLLVPVRTFEKMDAWVEPSPAGAVVRTDDADVELRAGRGVATVTISHIATDEGLPLAPRFVSAALYVPLRAVAELLGYTVSWDGSVVDIQSGRPVGKPGAGQVGETIQGGASIGDLIRRFAEGRGGKGPGQSFLRALMTSRSEW